MNGQKTLLIFGGTGMVGQQLLTQALAADWVSQVVAPTRRPLARHDKLENPIIDFEALPELAHWWKADAMLCALGTTIKLAGSQQAFRHVDHELVLQTAKLAKSAGTPCFVLNSSMGADAASGNFYLKVKGELEADLSALGFESLSLVRPSLLDAGDRPDSRPGEQLGLWFGKRLSAFIPKRYQPVSTRNVAKSMLEAALNAKTGIHIMESDKLHY
jgi:uncharacterized protein YbjT (DUF2867 family)